MSPAKSYHVLLSSKRSQLRRLAVTIAVAAVLALLSGSVNNHLVLLAYSLLFATGTGLIFRKFTASRIEVFLSPDDLSLKFGKNSEKKFSLDTIRAISESHDLFGDKVLRIEFRDRRLTFVRPSGTVMLEEYRALADTLHSLPHPPADAPPESKEKGESLPH